MKNSRSGEKIKLTSIDELLGVVNEESAMEIEIKAISPFKGHPFKVIADDKMEELINSVKESGVITPVLLRPAGENHYEMISGHRRMYAARKAGLSTVPAIVRDMADDEAVIAMVDANIQREELLPSEKAFAYKMKLNAMKRQAGRPLKIILVKMTRIYPEQCQEIFWPNRLVKVQNRYSVTFVLPSLSLNCLIWSIIRNCSLR